MIKMLDGIILACIWRKWYWLNAKAKWIDADNETEATKAAKIEAAEMLKKQKR